MSIALYLIILVALIALNVIASPDEPNWFLMLLVILWAVVVPYVFGAH